MRGLNLGGIAIGAELEDGRLRAVTITSDRPLSLASRFVGRSLSDAVAAMALLHAVCGQSHAVALTLAAEAAAGRSLDPAVAGAWTHRLAAERIGEHLRELHRHGANGTDLDALREAIALAQRLARGRDDDDRLSLLLQRLTRPDMATPVQTGRVDRLAPSDDAAVIAAMVDDPDFLSLPHLPGRCPEVGPAAREGWTAASPGATALARWREIDEAARWLAGADAGDRLVSAGPLGPGRGYGAVESPRGRLYYLVGVTDDGHLGQARVLAPTEWNFHPDGPFARACRGRPLGPDAGAELAALATDFAPCVAVDISFEDPDHA